MMTNKLTQCGFLLAVLPLAIGCTGGDATARVALELTASGPGGAEQSALEMEVPADQLPEFLDATLPQLEEGLQVASQPSESTGMLAVRLSWDDTCLLDGSISGSDAVLYLDDVGVFWQGLEALSLPSEEHSVRNGIGRKSYAAICDWTCWVGKIYKALGGTGSQEGGTGGDASGARG